MSRFGFVLGLLVVLAAGSAGAADWPRFRGPNGSGSAPEDAGAAPDEGLPIELSAVTAAWTRQVPFGQSSPIVARGLVFLTAADDDVLWTLAYDARTGEESRRRRGARREPRSSRWRHCR